MAARGVTIGTMDPRIGRIPKNATREEGLAWELRATVVELRLAGQPLDVDAILAGFSRAHSDQLPPEILARARRYIELWIERLKREP